MRNQELSQYQGRLILLFERMSKIYFGFLDHDVKYFSSEDTVAPCKSVPTIRLTVALLDLFQVHVNSDINLHLNRINLLNLIKFFFAKNRRIRQIPSLHNKPLLSLDFPLQFEKNRDMLQY